MESWISVATQMPIIPFWNRVLNESAGWSRGSLYAVEGMSSLGGTLLSVGIFFYTEHRFGWSLRHNLLLAAGQGLVYVLGALLASRLTRPVGRRWALVVLYAVLAAVTVPAIVWPTPLPSTLALLAYSFTIAMTWPMLESLVAGRAGPHELSRRLGLYNLVWSGVGAVALAANGLIIEKWPAGVFLIPLLVNVVGSLVMLANPAAEADAPPSEAQAHLEPEPALLSQRRLALWLSRLSLPATYVVIYSLMAMLPSLPLVRQFSPSVATPLCSVWLVLRCLAFLALGCTVWWHTRPQWLLWSAVTMLAAFLGIVLPATVDSLSLSWALVSMLAWQAVLGAAIGMIYAGSLYFGMVLSDGSTEHGGYHEALIGLGMVLGPGSAALSQWLRPGSPWPGIIAVTAVLSATVLAAGIAAVKAKRTR